MSFAPPSESELYDMFMTDYASKNVVPDRKDRKDRKINKRRISECYWYSPNKKAMLEVIPGIVAGYVTPPRVVLAVAPCTPTKNGPSTPDDVKKTGGWLPITPGKE